MILIFLQFSVADALKAEIKTEDCDDDCDVKPSTKRVTPQKSNGDSKTNGSGTSTDLTMSPASTARAELRRLQIYGAGPKTPGIKTKSNSQSNQTTPTKSRMNGNSARQSRQNANRRNHADPLAKYSKYFSCPLNGNQMNKN